MNREYHVNLLRKLPQISIDSGQYPSRQKTDDRGQKKEDRGQRTEDR